MLVEIVGYMFSLAKCGKIADGVVVLYMWQLLMLLG